MIELNCPVHSVRLVINVNIHIPEMHADVPEAQTNHVQNVTEVDSFDSRLTSFKLNDCETKTREWYGHQSGRCV